MVIFRMLFQWREEFANDYNAIMHSVELDDIISDRNLHFMKISNQS